MLKRLARQYSRKHPSHAAIGALGFVLGSVSTLYLVEEYEKTTTDPNWPSQWNVKEKEGFIVSYDRRLRNPNWVYEKLDKNSLKKTVDRLNFNFKSDTTTPKSFRVDPTDFANSGYDRGHLAPARDMAHSKDAMSDSFLMTNISPQVGTGFNRDYWARLEAFVRDLTRSHEKVHVITGPLYLPSVQKDGTHVVQYKVIGSPARIAVPTHFFKVIFAEKDRHHVYHAGFVLPNEPIKSNYPLTKYSTTIEEIEDMSGLTFFPHFDKNRQLCHHIACELPRRKKR